MRYVLSHLPLAIIYGLIIVVLRGRVWGLDIPLLLQELWWIIGVVVGVLLVFLDRIAYTFSFPDEQLSQQFAYYWKMKSYGQVLTLLDSRRYEQERLTFRSALFMILWIPLSFFALTSSTLMIGKGVVMGVMLHILWDSWRMMRKSPSRLKRRLFWQIKREFSDEEQSVFLWVMSFIFVLFSYWVR